MRLKVWVAGIVTAALLVGVPVAILHEAILFRMGSIQVDAGLPHAADIIVVLGGDYLGNRILKAAELAREGYAPLVLVSGAGFIYGSPESTLAVNLAVAHGYPRELFYAFPYPASSTADEARHIVPELRRRGVHRYILVTSPNHTGRAARIFRVQGRAGSGDLEAYVVAANDPMWAGGRWWTHREGRKLWLLEEMKRLSEIGL